MKKIVILLFLITSTFYSCENKIVENKIESNIQKESEDEQNIFENNDDTLILKASSKENNINIDELIKKVEEDLREEGALTVVINREGDAIYIMTTQSEAKDIRIHKLNTSNELNNIDYIKKHRDDCYEKLSEVVKEGEYLIIPINTQSEFQEEAISWISNEGKVKVYETKGEKGSEINSYN